MARQQVRCAQCGEVFPAEEVKDEALTCPHCAHTGRPAGVMRTPDFPSLETFTRSVKRSLELEEE